LPQVIVGRHHRRLSAFGEMRITGLPARAPGVILNLQFAYSAWEPTMPPPQLVMQTAYAELLERCAGAAFSDAFPEDGAFTPKSIKGRRYWYFQVNSSSGGGRTQKYVGPETPELLERIAHHREARDDERELRALVSTLVRSFGLPRPIPEIGDIIAALAKAGVFRLRGVLIGTTAYQTYSAMLGTKLPTATLQTGDVDIAQYTNVSIATGDRTPPMLDVLKQVDETFRAVPSATDGRRVTSYVAKGGLRVDFLTPNEGPETEKPKALPAFQTDAQPLRFLDYLIHEPEPAIILHHAGIYVHVPAPERYAVHKLIVSGRRQIGVAKRDKDIRQAEVLFEVLSRSRPGELNSAWWEAYERGKSWREGLAEGLIQFAPRNRNLALRAVDGRRDMLPALDLTFNNPPARYDADRDVVIFLGHALGSPVECAISREALDDHFGANGLGQDGRIRKFLENRTTIERMARTKYLSWPIEDAEAVLIKTLDVPKLLKEPFAGPRPSGRSRAKAGGVK
jgi:hypothetical protein